MNKSRDNLIASFTDELTPVRSFNARDGMFLVAVTAAVTLAAVAVVDGIWVDAIQGGASPFFWVTNGLLLLVGLASMGAVLAMASPGVGNKYDAPRWAVAMLSVLPIAALMNVASHGAHSVGVVSPAAVNCLIASLTSSIATGVALTLWLRRGAPVSLNAAGWFTGTAAGAIGTLLYGMSCDMDSVTHLGIWHVLPVAISALVGRIVVPKAVAW